MRWCSRRSAEAIQAEKAADEPRPAPTGRVDRTVRLKDGLHDVRILVSAQNKETSHRSSPCVRVMYKYRKATVAAWVFGGISEAGGSARSLIAFISSTSSVSG